MLCHSEPAMSRWGICWSLAARMLLADIRFLPSVGMTNVWGERTRLNAKYKSLGLATEALVQNVIYFFVALPSMNVIQSLPSMEISYFTL